MKPLTLENYTELQPYIAMADYNEYNSNIVTMLMWNNRYHTYFETFDTYALVYNEMPHREAVWLMPYTDQAHRKEAVEKIKALSAEEHVSFELHSMTKEFKDWLMECYPNQFLIWDCYDARDYIYDRQMQESLAGKKMQKRRNHFHAFAKEYEGRFYYRKMEKQDLPAVYDFLDFWKQNKDADDSIDAERIGIHLILEHMDTLPILAGCLFIDDKLEGFHIASMVSKDTVQIHVEKANKEIRGCYIAILKCFLASLPPHVAYVNREDDMGLSELRKAKTDMQPVHKIKKFGCSFEPIDLHPATKEELPAIQQLWLDSFEEETLASTNYFFEHLYDPSTTYTLTSEDGLLAMAQARVMPISLHQEVLQIPFLFGVATDQEYQGVGYMRKLIDHIIAQTTSPYIFVQAYNWDIYRALGFQEAYHIARYKIRKEAYTNVIGSIKEGDSEVLTTLYEQYVRHKDGYRLRDATYFTKMIDYYKQWKQTYQVLSIDGIPCAYALIEQKEDQLVAKEVIYTSDLALDVILSQLSLTPLPLFVYCDLACELAGRRKEELSMMVYCKNSDTYEFPHKFLQEEL